MTRVKAYIAQVIRINKISIFEIDEHLAIFSDAIRDLLIPDFADYGLDLRRFFVTNILKPDGDRQFEKFKDLHFRQYADIAEAELRQKTDVIYATTEAQKKIIDSQAMATKRAQEGYTYQQERGYDVAQEVAKNEAVGQFTNLGVGLGTIAGVGGVVGGVVGGTVKDALGSTTLPQTNPQSSQPQPIQTKCAKCGAVLPANAKFCLECGEKVAPKAPQVPDGMTICPTCGKTVNKGKFCAECGGKLE